MELLLALFVPLTFATFLVLERAFPARSLPPVRHWLAKCLVFFVIGGVLGVVIPAALASVTEDIAPFRLSALGLVPATLVLFAIGDLVTYVVHRLQHVVPFVWRWVHQMHHSAERVDIAGAVYFHPFDTAMSTALGVLLPAFFGAGPDVAALTGALFVFNGFFQHLNMRTPRWLGYIIQRPEQHSVHHARGVHAYNYANCPLWDLLFGTFRNPEGFVDEAGFWDGASSRVGAMLLGRDVAVRSGEAVSQAPTHAASSAATS